MALESINPATGETIETYDEMTGDEVKEVILQVHEAWQSWQHTGFDERAERLRHAATLLRQRTDRYARLMAEEMGKPLDQGRSEIEKCAWVCEYYADHGASFLAAETIETDASKSYVSFEPLGVVLAVMPWNFPFWQLFRFLAPALMAGNAGVLKHASNVQGCALAVEDVICEAGFPENLFRVLVISSDAVEQVIANPKIAAVTLTGSTRAGKAVAEAAGKHLKKTVLELGGSDPYLILADADLEAATTTCVESRLINSGQSCIAAKRFIVVDEVRRGFEALFVSKMRRQKMGAPLEEEEVDLGPQARTDLRDDLHEQVTQSVENGARLLCGGEIPEGEGAYYPPTVLTDVGPGMPAYEEETFGPVAAIIPVADEEEAIHVANDTDFGLGAAIFTQDVERGERLARERLRAGNCFVNGLVKSDPRLPFGGIKHSGYGRELSVFGIREFVNIKTVWVK